MFDSDGVLLVKEIIRRADGSLVLRSRNPDHGEQVLRKGDAEQLIIFGQVMWAGGLV